MQDPPAEQIQPLSGLREQLVGQLDWLPVRQGPQRHAGVALDVDGLVEGHRDLPPVVDEFAFVLMQPVAPSGEESVHQATPEQG